MKFIVCVLFSCFIPLGAYTQVVLLDKVYDFIQQKEFGKAENAIAIAEKNSATANDARTFYLKSFIYKELFLKESEKNKRNILRTKSMASLKKSKALDRDGSLGPQLKQLNDFISASIYNDGTESYNTELYAESVRYFLDYLSLTTNSQTWLDANYFVGSSYYNLNKLDSARIFLELVRGNNYDQPALYSDLAYLYLKLESKKPALRVVDEGRHRYSDNFDLQIAELNVLSKFQVYDTLELKGERFLQSNPDNIDVLLLTAASYEKNKKEDTHIKYFLKSESLYKKILKIDSTHYDGNYNLGVLYYNEAVELVNTSNIETNVDELGKILEKSSQLFEQALPFLLKIYDEKTATIKLLQALQAIYYNLNMKEQLLDINVKIKALN